MDSEILEDLSVVFLRPFNMTKNCLTWLWNERFWLRRDITWQDMDNVDSSSVRHPQAYELQLAVLLTFLLVLLRAVMDKCFFSRIAFSYGLKPARRASSEPVLEAHFSNGQSPSNGEMNKMAEELKWTRRNIERWFRIKRKENQCKMRKFNECAWRAFKYTCTFLYGLYVLYDEPWAVDTAASLDLKTWPHHHIKTEFYIYYMVELGYYLSVLLSLFTDVYRSDFMEQAVHHVATVVLLSFSWVANFVRIGVLVLTVHNAADIWLQTTKMCGYLGKMNLVPYFMGMFTSVWVLTRVYLYPVHILWPTIVEMTRVWDIIWPSAIVMVACLVLLQILHLIWTYYVVICLYRAWLRGSFKDERSEDEASTDEKED